MKSFASRGFCRIETATVRLLKRSPPKHFTEVKLQLPESVIKVFVDLYNKGLIYRGVRMVNWDPKALTALSDEEVI